MCDELYLTKFNILPGPNQDLTYFPYYHEHLNAFFSTFTVTSEFQEGTISAITTHYTK